MKALAAIALLNLCGVRVVRRTGFDSGTPEGFTADQKESEFGAVRGDTYDGSGCALRVAGKTGYLGATIYKPIEERDTRVTFAYKASGFKGLPVVQLGSARHKKNVHVSVREGRAGEWSVATCRLSTATDWGGKATCEGDTFNRLQIYGTPDPRAGKAVLLLDEVVVYEGEDASPPARVEGVRAELKDLAVRVSWERAREETLVLKYEIFRGVSPSSEPGAENKIGQTRLLCLVDDALSNFGVFYYRVRAVDAAGNRGPCSEACRLETLPEE